MKILVMGLPGSGKTYLTERLVPVFRQSGDEVADRVSESFQDLNPDVLNA